jgi:hypothetical protein
MSPVQKTKDNTQQNQYPSPYLWESPRDKNDNRLTPILNHTPLTE